MRILYLCSDLGIPVLGRKGASVHVRSLVAALGRAGHSVLLLSPVLNKSPWEEPASLDGTLIHLPPGPETVSSIMGMKSFNDNLGVDNSLPGELRRILYNQELGPKLERRFHSHPPDFIYERACLYGTAGAYLAAAIDVPLVVELNAPQALEQSTYRSTGLGGLAEQAERWALTKANAIIAVSTPLRDYAISLGADPARVHVLPNGVDASLFHPAPRDPDVRAGLALGDGPVIGFVGGLRPWHGLSALPRLAERLVTRFRDLSVVIVGDGPLRGELQREFIERGVGGNVSFTGSMPHEGVAEVIRAFDVALAPYPQAEHPFYFSPLKLFEYMACGVPVVTAAVGQITDVVRDGETGILCPPGDIDAVGTACERLLGDPELRTRLGRAASAHVLDNYTWDRNAACIVDVAETLKEPGRGSR